MDNGAQRFKDIETLMFQLASKKGKPDSPKKLMRMTTEFLDDVRSGAIVMPPIEAEEKHTMLHVFVSILLTRVVVSFSGTDNQITPEEIFKVLQLLSASMVEREPQLLVELLGNEGRCVDVECQRCYPETEKVTVH